MRNNKTHGVAWLLFVMMLLPQSKAWALVDGGYRVDSETQSNDVLQYVDPFIGTANYNACHPGAVCPSGLMSVTPFNVMGTENRYDKDSRWWSTPYDHTNSFFTGFAHVNLSGVGCPELGSLLVMPTTGPVDADFHHYGTSYRDEEAHPGHYGLWLEKYGIRADVTATQRTSCLRFRYPKGQGNILLHLGEGLTNESGAWVRWTSDTELEGMKLMGTFCYNPKVTFPLYFVLRVNRTPRSRGFWKRQRPMTAEAAWEADAGKIKYYPHYQREMAGDDFGAYLSMDCADGDVVEVSIGISAVSTEGARRNLDAEQQGRDYDTLLAQARQQWRQMLSRVEVEGGTPADRTQFYTALYHALIHPSILSDVDGRYPTMGGEGISQAPQRHPHYTIFSLWDTYRTLHPLLTLLYPRQQLDMMQSLVDMGRQQGFLPRWELFSQETLTMEGDPALPMLADAILKGLTQFDADEAYRLALKNADTVADNFIREDNGDYLTLGYVPLKEQYDNSVSHALEYGMADYALSQWAAHRGDKATSQRLMHRAQGYRHYYDKSTRLLRPKKADGTFYPDFIPTEGQNFKPSPGFHEGCSWNYTFAVPWDVEGLARLMGGKKAFCQHLDDVFHKGLFDPTNEPDIAYPYLFSRFPGYEHRTWQLTYDIRQRAFNATAAGLPGNDDTGTLSAWLVWTMMGLYPDCPAEGSYTLTPPAFDRVTLHLDAAIHGTERIVLSAPHPTPEAHHIRRLTDAQGRLLKGYRITHHDLLRRGGLHFELY